MIQLRYYI